VENDTDYISVWRELRQLVIYSEHTDITYQLLWKMKNNTKAYSRISLRDSGVGMTQTSALQSATTFVI